MDKYKQNCDKRIYVGNLCQDIRACDLYEHFIECGKILQVFYKQQPYAFIEFNDKEGAKTAISTKNHSILKTQTLVVGKYYRKGSKFDRNTNGNGEINKSANFDMKRFFSKTHETIDYEHKTCVILVEICDTLQYAKQLKDECMNLGINTDLHYLNSILPRSETLQNMYVKGFRFAIFFNDENIKRQSFSFITLRGVRTEYINIPHREGILLIYKLLNKSDDENNLPGNISNFIFKLINNENLTVTQYNVVIKYLKERRNKQLQLEIGTTEESIAFDNNFKFNELFKKVYKALNKVLEKKKFKSISNVKDNRIDDLIEKIINDEIIRNKLKDNF